MHWPIGDMARGAEPGSFSSWRQELSHINLSCLWTRLSLHLREFPKTPERTGAAGEQLTRDQPTSAGFRQRLGKLDSISVVWDVVVNWDVSPLDRNIRVYCAHEAERAQERPDPHKIHGPSPGPTSDSSRQGSRLPCYVAPGAHWKPHAYSCSLMFSGPFQSSCHPLSSSLPKVSRGQTSAYKLRDLDLIPFLPPVTSVTWAIT